MAELAATRIHGNLIVDGGIIGLTDTMVYASESAFQKAQEDKNEIPDIEIDLNNQLEDLGYNRNIFCEIPTGSNNMRVQAKQQLELFGYNGIYISSKLQDKSDIKGNAGNIVIEGNITLKKPGENNTTQYRIGNLDVGFADKLNSNRNISFTDGYLVYNLENILNNGQNDYNKKFDIKAVSTKTEDISLYYLPISTETNHYTLKNVKNLNGLRINNVDKNAELLLNNFTISSATNGETSLYTPSGNISLTTPNGIIALNSGVNIVRASNIYFTEQRVNLQNLLDVKVNNSRTINGHPLTADVAITWADIRNGFGNIFGSHGVPMFSYKDTTTKKETALTLSNEEWNVVKTKLGKGFVKFLVGLASGSISIDYKNNKKSLYTGRPKAYSEFLKALG